MASSRKTKLGERIVQARDAAGLTQTGLARLVGINQQTMHKIEAGITQKVKEDLLLALAEKLNVSPAWLALGIEEIDKVSDNGLQMAIAFDKCPPEVQRDMQALAMKYMTPLVREPRPPH